MVVLLKVKGHQIQIHKVVTKYQCLGEGAGLLMVLLRGKGHQIQT